MHLPPQIPVRAMLVAHNADYNGTYPVWSKVRSVGRTELRTVQPRWPRGGRSQCRAQVLPPGARARPQ